jgi:molybdate transport system regulatory protein
MEPKVKAWVVFPGGTKFGAGRARLLRLVDEEGSLNRAVQRMEMSYRAAWGYLQELEEAAGFAFVETSGGGSRLTDRARAFLDAFDRYEQRVATCADDTFTATFGDVDAR